MTFSLLRTEARSNNVRFFKMFLCDSQYSPMVEFLEDDGRVLDLLNIAFDSQSWDVFNLVSARLDPGGVETARILNRLAPKGKNVIDALLALSPELVPIDLVLHQPEDNREKVLKKHGHVPRILQFLFLASSSKQEAELLFAKGTFFDSILFHCPRLLILPVYLYKLIWSLFLQKAF